MEKSEPPQQARISTGIEGLDKILSGGIPSKNQVIVGGGPGAGKTLLSMEILYHNAKRGIHCAFVALEEPEKEVLSNFKKAFPAYSDISDLVKSNVLVMGGQDVAAKIQSGVDSESYSFSNIASSIEAIIKSNDSKCVVIDSLSLIKLIFSEMSSYRKCLLSLSSDMRRLAATTIMTLELPHTGSRDMLFGPEFFVFDGTIMMYQNLEENKRIFNMEVMKMRGSSHSLSLTPYEITSKGFKVFSAKEE
ncbi:MAG TPA: ATPase domain-containing protein [Candidatus Acidoferrum sp.]|nr:ATPase domain-containing protein [Candidatus Acidoferrum sp.]